VPKTKRANQIQVAPKWQIKNKRKRKRREKGQRGEIGKGKLGFPTLFSSGIEKTKSSCQKQLPHFIVYKLGPKLMSNLSKYTDI